MECNCKPSSFCHLNEIHVTAGLIERCKAGKLKKPKRGNGKIELPIAQRSSRSDCIHRGKLIDKTTCKCSVWACAIHGTCSNNQKAGVKVCKDCPDYSNAKPTESE